jgi:hypothetical protein
MTQKIANDSDMHISPVINVSRCQPSPRFETGVRIPVGTPAQKPITPNELQVSRIIGWQQDWQQPRSEDGLEP